MIDRRTCGAGFAISMLTACRGTSSILSSSGQPGGDEATLGRLFTTVGIVVVVVVAALLLMGIFRRRPPADANAIVRQGGGVAWILAGGIIAPALILVTLFIFVLKSLSTTAQPPYSNVAGTFEIVGHQWWWEVRRIDDSGEPQFVTANEMHIPVGRAVRLRLSSADVIHSFWVPELAGKTDVVPGRINKAWLKADKPGVYIARCAEYCGMQHAQMALVVVAESDAAFARWLASQSAEARPPETPEEQRGLDAFLGSPCASCHQIRGTPAGAIVGPDLTHLASRRTIGAGALPNTDGNLTGWIANSQTIKPGNAMPAMYLEPTDLHAIVEYLHSLK
ncbi:MAG TPA: cytochrome c oxidase subunit II [Gemmatimonadaceae bacterium]